MNLPSDEKCERLRPLSALVAGTASRVRWQPYLNVPVCRCRINNRKELHFSFRPRPTGNNGDVVGAQQWFKDQAVIRLERRILNRSGVGDKAVPSTIWGQASSGTTPASGGSIQQAERAPDQRLASFRGHGRHPVADGHKAERDQIVERESGRGRQPSER